MRRTLAIPLLVLGCAPSLSGFQPAHVAPRGHVQAEAGLDVSVPTGTISRTIDAAETLAEAARSRNLSDDERRRVIEAGANLAMNPPAAVTHAALAFVPIERWEIGVRSSSGAWRLGVRHQLLARETHGWDLSAGLGLQRFAYEFPAGDVVPILTLEDFVRWSVDVPVIAGTSGRWYRLWGGPRLVFSRFSSEMRLEIPAAGERVLATADGTAAFVGAQGGAALGYRWLFVGFELTVVHLFSGARLTLAGQGQDVDLGGTIVYPGVALMGEF